MKKKIEIIDDFIGSVYRREEYPVLADQAVRWMSLRPLDGVRVLDAAPVFRNTLLKHRALLAGGADLAVGISEVMPYDPAVVACLRRAGVPVVRAGERPSEVDIVLDCAAAFRSWNPRIGYAELTRSGVDAYRDAEKPVYLADSGRIKKIETTLGTGESYFRAMASLGYGEWRGKKIVVFGSGKVGTGIILYAAARGAEVTVVTDPATVGPAVRQRVSEVIAHTDLREILRTLPGAYAVVTATGVAGALADERLSRALASSDALLANMGVEDEFGGNMPAGRVLAGKRPLNFLLEEPTQVRYIDPTLALHNEAAVCLLDAPEAGLIEPAPELEERLLAVCRRDGLVGGELDFL